MQIQVTKEHRPERCLYCHDSLGDRFFTCDSCGATYHRECTQRCVNLGCQGAVHLDPVARESEQRHFSRLTSWVVFVTFGLPSLFAVTAMGLWRDLLSIDPFVVEGLAVVAAIAFGSLFLLDLARRLMPGTPAPARPASPKVVLGPGARSPASQGRPDEPAAPTAVVAPPPPAPAPAGDPPAPGELQMPSMFASRPIEMGKATSAEDVERARHQREARNDRTRPPGLGRTI